MFSIYYDPLLVVFPQRGYRIKTTHNQKNMAIESDPIKPTRNHKKGGGEKFNRGSILLCMWRHYCSASGAGRLPTCFRSARRLLI